MQSTLLKSRAQRPRLAIVIPCFNEAAVLELLRARLVPALSALDAHWSVLFVDDGSRDATPQILASFHEADPRLRVVVLARNFGHQTAVSAGLRHAGSDADVVCVLDADLQDPPELLVECLRMWRDGADVVYAVRTARKETLLMRAAYALFYRLLRTMAATDIPLDSGDFSLMDRRVVEVLRQMPEQNPFVRGMRAWTGFDQRPLRYEREARAAGQTKYPFRKLLKLAVDGLLSSSAAPLRFATYIGFGVVLASLSGIFFVVAWRFLGFTFMGHAASSIPGWAGMMTASFFFGGVQLLVLGVAGEYIARIYDEVRGRPRWVIAWTAGVQAHDDTSR